ncbi:hypothetical protein WP8W19C02_P20510 (plasmid) [Enterobacter cloacae]|nr:hypothetical protein WP8W19C02_P20510 [Enterobacter cloacae]
MNDMNRVKIMLNHRFWNIPFAPSYSSSRQ